MIIFEITVACLFGLVLGSFMNACIDRWPLQFASDATRQKLLELDFCSDIKEHLNNKTLSIAIPVRSLCFDCGRQLTWYENIPLLSYLWLGGACRGCGVRYGARAFWVELLNGVFYGLLAWQFGISGWVLLLALNCSLVAIGVVILQEHLQRQRQ